MQALKSKCSLAVAVVLTIFGTGRAFASTSCPLTLQVAAFQETVTAGNAAALRDAIVNATAIPVIDATGVCSDVVLIADGISSGDISTSQVEAYRSRIATILVPGDKVFAYTWERPSGETVVTLGVTTADVSPKFEPITTAEPGLDLNFNEVSSSGAECTIGQCQPTPDVALTSYVLTSTVLAETGLGTTGLKATKKINVITANKKTIQDESETITFVTGIFWDAAATKVATKIALGGVDCKKVVSTITIVTGFKSLKVSAGGGGYSGSVEVEGRLGANAQVQETDIMCADGTALHDGVPVK